MLLELRIRNFALIEELSVPLGPGLNVLSGETGAGKSIIVDALSLLLGERASADVVRTGADRASVEGIFELHGQEAVTKWLHEQGLEAEDGLLVLKREVAREGRSRAWINGSPTIVGVLGQLGALLVSLHGQHEHQTLLRRDEQREILDAYAGHQALAAEVRHSYEELRAVRRQMEELEERRREVASRADFLRFQAKEIEEASLAPDEEEKLEEEARRLEHSEELQSITGSLYEAVSGGEEALVERLGSLRRSLENLARIDPSQESARELYDTAYYALTELGEQMERYSGSVEHDPGRLQEINQRQDLLYRLKKKYGSTLSEVIATGEAVRAELGLLEEGEFQDAELRRQEAALQERFQALVTRLSAGREKALKSLSRTVSGVLPELGMGGGRFEAVALPLSTAGASGAEDIEFRVSLNKGFDPKPLAQVASGGELSRVMLALKTILARLDAVPTLVFDEVDAGVGGKVALQLGDKLRQVAGSHQVFAITHLPQIASRAQVHLLVKKAERAGVTTTEVLRLEAEERIDEVARMLGGDPESSVSREHARELLARGAQAA